MPHNTSFLFIFSKFITKEINASETKKMKYKKTAQKKMQHIFGTLALDSTK